MFPEGLDRHLRLGGDSGVVEGLATEASTLVEVSQVQAVIRR